MAETKTNIPVEIKMGNAGTNNTNLPAFKEGSIIFTKDTKKIYIDPVGETERIAVGGTEVAVDAELSETSTNPVQNKIITAAINDKQDTITEDTELHLSGIKTTYYVNTNIITANKNIQIVSPTDKTAITLETASDTLKVKYANLSGNYVNAYINGVKDGVSDNDAVNVSQLNTKQDKIGTLNTHKFESGGIARTLSLGGHKEDSLHIQDGDFVVDKFKVPNSSNNSFSIGTNAIFEENMNVGKTLVVSTIKASGDARAAILTLGNGGVEISQANSLSFFNSAIISNVNAIQGNGSSLYAFAGSPGGSSFININNKKYVKIGDYNSGQKPISLLGISTPISAADTTLGIADADLPYQAVNKKYVDDAIGNINSILATMFNDVSTQSDEEPTDDEEVIA